MTDAFDSDIAVCLRARIAQSVLSTSDPLRASVLA